MYYQANSYRPSMIDLESLFHKLLFLYSSLGCFVSELDTVISYGLTLIESLLQHEWQIMLLF